MNKQEIQERINQKNEVYRIANDAAIANAEIAAEAVARIKELQSKLKEPEQWKPLSFGNFNPTAIFETMLDKSGHNFFCYVTRKDAEKVAQHLFNQLKLKQLADSLNGDWVADWGDSDQPKFVVFYKFEAERWVFDCFCYASFTTPAFSQDASEKAVEILNSQDIGVKL